MSIRSTWNLIEAALTKRGFQLSGAEDVPQGRKVVIRVQQIDGDQELRGSVGSGKVRVSWKLDVILSYDMENDIRQDRAVAEDAEDVIAALYSITLRNHQFVQAVITREGTVLTNTLRFAFQDDAEL